MLKFTYTALFTCLLTLMWIAPVQGQAPEKQFNREIHFGTTLGNGFNPRLIYKKVREKSVARYLLNFNSGTRTATRNLNGASIYDQDITKISSLTIALGMGREWRADLSNKFQVYGGGDLSLLYTLSSTTQRRTQLVSGSSFDVENRTIKAHSPGLAFSVFGGFRLALTERISFSAEAGPSISSTIRLEKDKALSIENPGTVDQEVFLNETTSQVFDLNLKAIGPLFVQFAIHF
jgi:hypothetical protein